MKSGIHIDASFGSGKTLNQFADLIKQRMQWMNESARDSVAACAINALRGIRTVTKVAKPNRIKVNVQLEGRLIASFSTRGNHSRFPVIRYAGTKIRYNGPEQQRFNVDIKRIKDAHVYRFVDEFSKKKQTYLIAALSEKDAQQTAKKIVYRKSIRYAGLAKRAISYMMMKTVTKTIADNVPMHVSLFAEKMTKKTEIVKKNGDKGHYGLILTDNLLYAISAVKGGYATLETQMKKAMNKIVSVINQRIKKKGFLQDEYIPTPFPELTKKRKKK